MGHPVDYFHINSIDLTPDGGLLVSARNTWAVYKISRRTGEVRWRLGGKKSDFKMGKGTVFAWQHDARHQGTTASRSSTTARMPQVEPQSRGLVIQLDQKSGTARLVRKYVHRPNRIVSRFMGNMQALDNGNVMIGWGSEPYFTEFGPTATIVLDGRLPDGGMNYRAFRLPWHGRPSLPPARPSTALRTARHRLRVVERRDRGRGLAARVGPCGRALRAGTAVARKGFETALRTTPGRQVRARGRARRVRACARPVETIRI